MSNGWTRYCWKLFNRSCIQGFSSKIVRRGPKTKLATSIGLSAAALALLHERRARDERASAATITCALNLDSFVALKRVIEGAASSLHGLGWLQTWTAPRSALSWNITPKSFCETLDTASLTSLREPAPAPLGAAYQYVIVGGGPAAHEAAAELARLDSAASLLLITDVDYDPSWTREQCKRWADHHRVFHRGYRLEKLDVERKLVKFEGADPIRYGRLLLATGQENRCPNSCVIGPNATQYFVPAGYLHAGTPWRDANEAMHFTLVGVDWYACVLASTIRSATNGYHTVTMLLPESEPLGKFLPRELAKQVAQSLRGIGIELVPYATPRYIRERVDSDTGEADAEIFFTRTYDRSIAVSFRTDRFTFMEKHRPPGGVAVLRHVPHLQIDPLHGGVVCNRELVAASDVYVAGDALCFSDPVLGRRRAWGVDHALHSAQIASRNMTGSRLVYQYQPRHFFRFANLEFFWVGDLDATIDETYQYICPGAETTKEQGISVSNSSEHTVVVYVRRRSTITGVLWVRSLCQDEDTASIDEQILRDRVGQQMVELLGRQVPSYGGSGTASDIIEPHVREIFQQITPCSERMRRRHTGTTAGNSSRGSRRGLAGNRRSAVG